MEISKILGKYDPFKQYFGSKKDRIFCRNQNKDFSILTETHINHDEIHHIRGKQKK